MPIVKIEKREPGYAMIDNRALNDPRLSLKARGLLVYLLSKPNDWKVRIADVANNHADGSTQLAALKGKAGMLKEENQRLTELPNGFNRQRGTIRFPHGKPTS
jgi:hypothetical protein